jgi:hypothetical protein
VRKRSVRTAMERRVGPALEIFSYATVLPQEENLVRRFVQVWRQARLFRSHGDLVSASCERDHCSAPSISALQY